MIRSSMKNTEMQLSNNRKIIRCHKSFIANLNLVNKISGNAQGLKLLFDNYNISVPVSRNKTKEIREYISQ